MISDILVEFTVLDDESDGNRIILQLKFCLVCVSLFKIRIQIQIIQIIQK